MALIPLAVTPTVSESTGSASSPGISATVKPASRTGSGPRLAVTGMLRMSALSAKGSSERLAATSRAGWPPSSPRWNSPLLALPEMNAPVLRSPVLANPVLASRC